LLKGKPMPDADDKQYIQERLDDQLKYFESTAANNKRWYRFFKKTAILCNLLTTMAIALAFTVPEIYKIYMGIGALILSTAVLATYQIEEFHNYGAKWEKFRLVAEQLKSEKYLYLNDAGRYCVEDKVKQHRIFVETIEGIIKGTDISYFGLMIEPGKRIERRLENISRED
jgi:hypothetical protein